MSEAKHPIEIHGLSVSYGSKRVLTNIYLQIEKGSLVGVIGPNGAGKSTLFKSILGLVEPNAGDIKIFGEEIRAQRKRIAYVPQRDDVDWSFPATVMDIVLMGRYPHLGIFQRIGQQDREIALRALQDLGIEAFRDRQIGALSGGQQQRVFIARALAQQPDIFMLDEPFVGVDITTEEKIISILKAQADAGKTLLVVHHDLANVRTYFDSVILLNQRMIAYGKTDEVFTDQNVALAYGAQLTILHKTGMIGR